MAGKAGRANFRRCNEVYWEGLSEELRSEEQGPSVRSAANRVSMQREQADGRSNLLF